MARQTRRTGHGDRAEAETLRWAGQVRGELLLAELKRIGRRPANALARLLSRTPLTPNAVTVLAFVLNVGVAVVLATGLHFLGGILVLVVGALDMLDGALARLTGRVTKFGSFLDSTLDRLSEAALFFGLLVFYLQHSAETEAMLVFLVFVGSVMISYAKARAEALQLKCDVGLLARPERTILLAAGLLLSGLGLMPLFLWILLFLTYFTVVQRIVHVWRASTAED
jgi:CDP-diacylglycerol--glycerol-3-phosphate 3-phosphatidyltransferase